VIFKTWFLLALLAVLPAVALAQAPSPSQSTGDKQPAPPLFPKHRRGLYRNAQGIEVIDATPQSPPLDTDDPGTPDRGEFEFNFTTHLDHTHQSQHYELVSVDANYGVLPVLFGHPLPTQLKFEFPVSAAAAPGEEFAAGVGEVEFGVKMNFYRDEHRGLAVALYPQVGFAPSSRGVEKGLADAGQTLILPLLVGKEFHAFSVVANVGIESPLHDAERDTAYPYGVGFGRALTRKVAGMIELRGESSHQFHDVGVVYLNGGIIHGVRNLITYANIGHSLYSRDDLGHTYAGFGVKLLLE
jgi:hypothetical protein